MSEPMTPKLPDFEDADVQTVYELLCPNEIVQYPPEEHWEGATAPTSQPPPCRNTTARYAKEPG